MGLNGLLKNIEHGVNLWELIITLQKIDANAVSGMTRSIILAKRRGAGHLVFVDTKANV